MTLEEILGSNSSNITIKNAKPKVDVGAVMSQYNTNQADAINSPYNKEWKGFIAIENGTIARDEAQGGYGYEN